MQEQECLPGLTNKNHATVLMNLFYASKHNVEKKLMNEAQVSLRGFSKSVHQKSQHIPNSFKRGC